MKSKVGEQLSWFILHKKRTPNVDVLYSCPHAEPEKKEGGGCRMCNVLSSTPDERTAHYKSHWHLFNLKLKLSGQSAISEKEFSELQNAGELSSGDEHEGSGDENSESDSEEEVKPSKEPEDEDDMKGREKSPKLTFVLTNGTTLTLWRNLFPREPHYIHDGEYLSFFGPAFTMLAHQHKWAVLMCGGGHFAGALFHGEKIVKHKTFRRYTVRKKQGGSQSTRDKQGHAPQSAGAQIRRANETKLKDEIMHLLSVDWASDLKTMQLVFLVAPGANKYSVIRDGLLIKEDARLRNVPFTTGRATLVEVKRVHGLLSRVEKGVHTSEEIAEAKKAAEAASAAPPAAAGAPVPTQANTRTTEREPENLLLNAAITGDVETVRRLVLEGYAAPVPRDAMKINTPLYAAAKNGNAEMVEILLTQPGIDPSIPVPADLFRTALHAAALNGDEHLCELLLQRGADPTLRDKAGKTPADLITSKKLRSFISEYAAEHPEQFDWRRSNVQPLTAEEQKEREEAKAEKLRQKKKGQKERQKLKKVEEKEKAVQDEIARKRKEEEDKEKAELQAILAAKHAKEAAMTDRDKRAMAAEARLGLTKGGARLCDFCGAALTGVPFERFEWKYCSTKCVVGHKQKIGK